MVQKESLKCQEEILIVYAPSVAIIMPFEHFRRTLPIPNNNSRNIIERAKIELRKHYSELISLMILNKLESAINDLDLTSMNQSVAIYISPHFEKVIYLDLQIEECIIVIKKYKRIF